jgi:hypothetical protein
MELLVSGCCGMDHSGNRGDGEPFVSNWTGDPAEEALHAPAISW